MKNLIVLLVSLLFFGCMAAKSFPDKDHKVDGAITAEIIRNIGKPGDWIIARGIDFPNNMVATLTNMPLSHAAVYDKENDLVIEADSTGIHSTDLETFLGKMNRVILIRPMWAANGNGDKAVENAHALLGSKYDYTGLIGLGSDDRYYCTELAIAVYRPFMTEKPSNPIPNIIMPGQMYHWGRIIFDTGPYDAM